MSNTVSYIEFYAELESDGYDISDISGRPPATINRLEFMRLFESRDPTVDILRKPEVEDFDVDEVNDRFYEQLELWEKVNSLYMDHKYYFINNRDRNTDELCEMLSISTDLQSFVGWWVQDTQVDPRKLKPVICVPY